MVFQSTHSITECDSISTPAVLTPSRFQSTHSITECDSISTPAVLTPSRFQSTHSITECDRAAALPSTSSRSFQSTHSITECDVAIYGRSYMMAYHFNPRTPLQSAIVRCQRGNPRHDISIHALHYRVRSGPPGFDVSRCPFQSTHSITECDL